MTFEQAWKEIHDNFKWKRVRDTMTLLKWEWGAGEDAVVPSIRRLKETAHSICHYAWVEDSMCATGGFQARKKEDGIVLEFILEYWRAEEEE